MDGRGSEDSCPEHGFTVYGLVGLIVGRRQTEDEGCRWVWTVVGTSGAGRVRDSEEGLLRTEVTETVTLLNPEDRHSGLGTFFERPQES